MRSARFNEAPREIRVGERVVEDWSFSAEKHQVVFTLPESAAGRRIEMEKAASSSTGPAAP